jgi:hypothetical protein
VVTWLARAWRDLLGALFPGAFVFGIAWVVHDRVPLAPWPAIAATVALFFLGVALGRRGARARARTAAAEGP